MKTVKELMQMLALFNETDNVYLTTVEGSPLLFVENDVVLGHSCDCNTCEDIRKTLPDFVMIEHGGL